MTQRALIIQVVFGLLAGALMMLWWGSGFSLGYAQGAAEIVPTWIVVTRWLILAAIPVLWCIAGVVTRTIPVVAFVVTPAGAILCVVLVSAVVWVGLWARFWFSTDSY